MPHGSDMGKPTGQSRVGLQARRIALHAGKGVGLKADPQEHRAFPRVGLQSDAFRTQNATSSGP